MNSILSYYYRSVTRGRRGSGLSCTFLKIGRNAMILRKSVLILVIFRLNFSIKMGKLKFLSFSRGKSSKYFLFDLTFWSFWWNVYQSAIIQRKLPCPNKFLFMRLRIGLRKIRFVGSLVEHFKKIMKMLNVSTFSFIILNLVKEGILDPSCYYTRWHMYEKSNMKAVFVEHF